MLLGPGARLEVFLDQSNFYNGLKSQFGDGRYHFTNLVREVLRGRKLVGWNFYCGAVDAALEPGAGKAQAFFHSYLQTTARREGIPLNMRLRPIAYPPGFPHCARRPVEKGVDALLVQDVIVGAFDNRFDAALIISGDRDFAAVVEFLKARFPKIGVCTIFPNSRRHLYDLVSHCFDEW